MLLKDKVVLITGAAGGIGIAAAKAFAKEGAKLALVDLNEDALKKVLNKWMQVISYVFLRMLQKKTR